MPASHGSLLLCSCAASFHLLQFCFNLHQKVAYEMLLHKQRQKLHAEAAMLLEDQGKDFTRRFRRSPRYAEWQKQLAEHWICAVQGTVAARRTRSLSSSQPAAAMSNEQLQLAAATLQSVLDTNFHEESECASDRRILVGRLCLFPSPVHRLHLSSSPSCPPPHTHTPHPTPCSFLFPARVASPACRCNLTSLLV